MTKEQLLDLIEKSKEANGKRFIWMEFLKDAPNGSVFAEFGVWKGRSLNYMSSVRPDCTFHGYDSFEGLPEDWKSNAKKGKYSADLSTLKFNKNVEIHKGLFADTIQTAAALPNIFGIHIDCDLGSSTTTVLDGLKDAILKSKSYILFDEFYNYRGYEKHEFSAFLDWVTKNNIDFDVLARNADHQQVLIKIK